MIQVKFGPQNLLFFKVFQVHEIVTLFFLFKNVNQNENYEETSHVYMHKENKE